LNLQPPKGTAILPFFLFGKKVWINPKKDDVCFARAQAHIALRASPVGLKAVGISCRASLASWLRTRLSDTGMPL